MSGRGQQGNSPHKLPHSQQTLTQMSREKVTQTIINWRVNVRSGHTTHQIVALDVSFNMMLRTEDDQLINFCTFCDPGTNIYDVRTYKDRLQGAGF